MKLLTIVVPCYNSEAYMAGCLDTLVVGGEDVEVIIINDGSTDSTLEIARDYEARYPGIVRVCDKENGGHGSGVNKGIELAEGMYFKVVDSDDHLDHDAYMAILGRLKELAGGSETLDLMISNFVYDKAGAKRKKVMHYRHILPENRIFRWNDCKHFMKGHYILMHSVIYRTKLLRECGMVLPEHTFYVDNMYVFEPMPYVRTLYYMDVDFYKYFIGREDQSVNENVMIGRIDQQLKVNRLMVDYYCDHRKAIGSNRKLEQCMYNYLEIVTVISIAMALRSGTKENLRKRKELWEYIKSRDVFLFAKLRYGILGGCMNLPGRGGRKISLGGYKMAQKVFKFN